MDEKFYSIVVNESNHKKFDDALSDVLCWLDGYQAAGGTYSPGSVEVLRDLRARIIKGYNTQGPEK